MYIVPPGPRAPANCVPLTRWKKTGGPRDVSVLANGSRSRRATTGARESRDGLGNGERKGQSHVGEGGGGRMKEKPGQPDTESAVEMPIDAHGGEAGMPWAAARGVTSGAGETRPSHM